MTPLLEVRNLVTHFHTQDGVVKALRGVSYDVARGETVALVGESGCGKSVSILSILRLLPEPGSVISGEAMFDGTDLFGLSEERMRKVRGGRIAMIFQEPMTSLNPLLSIGRQISEAVELHQGMGRQEAFREAVNLLEMVGIPGAASRARDYPHQFSGGMRQRVMIAMAISCRPQLIIADEPTTALDVTVQAQLLELLQSLTRERGISLVLITHNLGIVARYARRVYVMYSGGVVEHGPAQAIYHDPRHPYTVGLLASVPRLDEPRKVRLVPIEGQPPDLINPPAGCAFFPRCSCPIPGMDQKRPALAEVAPGHFSACPAAPKGLKL